MANGIKVVRISRSIGLDICDYQTLRGLPKIDAVVHLAAKPGVAASYEDPHSLLHVNVIGTLNALQLCREHQALMVFTSSYVYGQPRQLPINEDHPVEAWNPYAATKLMGEDFCKFYHRFYQVSSRILRVFNVYGPGQGNDFLIPTIVNGLREGSLTLKHSRPRRDFIHVSDVVDAMTRCVELPVDGVDFFNIGSGRSYSVEEIVALARAISQRPLQVRYLNEPRRDEVNEVVADCSRLRKIVGWEPKVDLATGLQWLVMATEPNAPA